MSRFPVESRASLAFKVVVFVSCAVIAFGGLALYVLDFPPIGVAIVVIVAIIVAVYVAFNSQPA